MKIPCVLWRSVISAKDGLLEIQQKPSKTTTAKEIQF
jgi:hypothetical protein